jgi:hypothetical protein
MKRRHPDAQKNGPVAGAGKFWKVYRKIVQADAEASGGRMREAESLATRGRNRRAPDQAARLSGFAQST